MISKVIVGGFAVASVAVAILMMLLLDAQEAKGKLAAEVSEAAAIAERQEKAKEAVERSLSEVQQRLVEEQERADKATEALVASKEQLALAKTDFEGRLELARQELSNEEMVCAMQPIPAAYIRSLRE